MAPFLVYLAEGRTSKYNTLRRYVGSLVRPVQPAACKHAAHAANREGGSGREGGSRNPHPPEELLGDESLEQAYERRAEQQEQQERDGHGPALFLKICLGIKLQQLGPVFNTRAEAHCFELDRTVALSDPALSNPAALTVRGACFATLRPPSGPMLEELRALARIFREGGLPALLAAMASGPPAELAALRAQFPLSCRHVRCECYWGCGARWAPGHTCAARAQEEREYAHNPAEFRNREFGVLWHGRDKYWYFYEEQPRRKMRHHAWRVRPVHHCASPSLWRVVHNGAEDQYQYPSYTAAVAAAGLLAVEAASAAGVPAKRDYRWVSPRKRRKA